MPKKRYRTTATPTIRELRQLAPIKRKTIWKTVRLMIGLAREPQEPAPTPPPASGVADAEAEDAPQPGKPGPQDAGRRSP